MTFRERLRTHSIESSGKLKISPEQHCDFTAEDLKDLGEIGRGAYGSVNNMVHKPSGQIMAVKVIVQLNMFSSKNIVDPRNLSEVQEENRLTKRQRSVQIIKTKYCQILPGSPQVLKKS